MYKKNTCCSDAKRLEATLYLGQDFTKGAMFRSCYSEVGLSMLISLKSIIRVKW